MSSDRETIAALGDGARRWIAGSYGEARRRATVAGEGLDRTAWAEMAEMGWLGIAISEADGGLGLGLPAFAAIAEAIGAGNLPEPVSAVAGVALPLLVGSKADLVADAVAGLTIVVLAHAEPDSGFDRRHVTARAERTSAGYRLSGDKAAVEGGGAADAFVVTALLDDAVSIFRVARDAPGLSVTPFRAIDGRVLADLSLRDVRVPATARLPGGQSAVDAALDRGALLAMAEAVGAMAVLLDDTLEHLRTRQQFGQPLARFQVLQHRAVNMSIALEEARATVEFAAAEDPEDAAAFGRAVATAKVVAGRAARRISREAVQLHGGLGITDELRVSHLFRRLVAAETLYGDAAAYTDRFRALDEERRVEHEEDA